MAQENLILVARFAALPELWQIFGLEKTREELLDVQIDLAPADLLKTTEASAEAVPVLWL